MKEVDKNFQQLKASLADLPLVDTWKALAALAEIYVGNMPDYDELGRTNKLRIALATAIVEANQS